MALVYFDKQTNGTGQKVKRKNNMYEKMIYVEGTT